MKTVHSLVKLQPVQTLALPFYPVEKVMGPDNPQPEAKKEI